MKLKCKNQKNINQLFQKQGTEVSESFRIQFQKSTCINFKQNTNSLHILPKKVPKYP